jgi:transcriptional regulator with XRE-family HTH domain
MEQPHDIRDFLASRRARLTPQQVGLPDFGGRRRVAGLRREEVALLAGMSAEYYVRFERGNASGVSEGIIDGVSRALRLDDTERAHLHDLVRAANDGVRPVRRRAPARPRSVAPSVQQLLDALTGVPALVQDGRLDVLGTNAMARALFDQMFDDAERTPNFARYLFLDPRSTGFYRDWDESADQLVALLRIETGRAPFDRGLSDLIGELSTRSDAFRALWGSHDVREHRTGMKRIHHDTLGDVELDYQALDVAGGPGLQLVAFTAEPASASATALQLLGNLTATATTSQPPRP